MDRKESTLAECGVIRSGVIKPSRIVLKSNVSNEALVSMFRRVERAGDKAIDREHAEQAKSMGMSEDLLKTHRAGRVDTGTAVINNLPMVTLGHLKAHLAEWGYVWNDVHYYEHVIRKERDGKPHATKKYVLCQTLTLTPDHELDITPEQMARVLEFDQATYGHVTVFLNPDGVVTINAVELKRVQNSDPAHIICEPARHEIVADDGIFRAIAINPETE